MLILKFFKERFGKYFIQVKTHNELLEEIYIKRTLLEHNGSYLYEVFKPEKYSHVRVLHKRKEGWMSLVLKVLIHCRNKTAKIREKPRGGS